MKCDTLLEAVSPMSSLGLAKIRTEDAGGRTKDHMEFLCELYLAQIAPGRYYVHDQTSAGTLCYPDFLSALCDLRSSFVTIFIGSK